MAVLETEDLTYTYSVGTPFEKTAVNNVSLKIEEGEMIGVMGHTGSGKSTLFKLVLGAYDADGALPLGLDTHQHAGDFLSFHVVPLGACPPCGSAYRRAGSGGAVGLPVGGFAGWGA